MDDIRLWPQEVGFLLDCEAFLSSTDGDEDHYLDHVLRASFRSGVGMFLDTSASSSLMR